MLAFMGGFPGTKWGLLGAGPFCQWPAYWWWCCDGWDMGEGPCAGVNAREAPERGEWKEPGAAGPLGMPMCDGRGETGAAGAAE